MDSKSEAKNSDLELQPTSALAGSRSTPLPATETTVNAAGSTPVGKFARLYASFLSLRRKVKKL